MIGVSHFQAHGRSGSSSSGVLHGPDGQGVFGGGCQGDFWRVYEAQVSPLELASIQAAPVKFRPMAKEPSTYFSAELVLKRAKAHSQVDNIAACLAKNGVSLEVSYVRFAECLTLAIFELRHKFIISWAGFVVLFVKLFGPAIAPWLASLFLAALAQPLMPRPQFNLEEVLAFAQVP